MKLIVHLSSTADASEVQEILEDLLRDPNDISCQIYQIPGAPLLEMYMERKRYESLFLTEVQLSRRVVTPLGVVYQPLITQRYKPTIPLPLEGKVWYVAPDVQFTKKP